MYWIHIQHNAAKEKERSKVLHQQFQCRSNGDIIMPYQLRILIVKPAHNSMKTKYHSSSSDYSYTFNIH